MVGLENLVIFLKEKSHLVFSFEIRYWSNVLSREIYLTNYSAAAPSQIGWIFRTQTSGVFCLSSGGVWTFSDNKGRRQRKKLFVFL